MAQPFMGQRDELARKRVVKWLAESEMTQTALAEKIGRNQAWMSRYLDGDFDTDLETLERLALAFSHTLFELLDTHGNPIEAEVLERWRALKPTARSLLVDVLREWTPNEKRVRTRSKNGER